MATPSFERLSALDNSFLLLEKPNAYMHVASTQVFEAGPLRTPEGGIDAERLRAYIAARLHQIPRYRQKLRWIPLENHPVWVDDAEFNLDYHVRHTSLPRPGSEAQLKRLSARVMQQHLDRDRPLWELWVVEGLEGDRFAVISKVHHCMIDGVSGVDLMNILMTPEPDTSVPEAPDFVPRPEPGAAELLRSEAVRWGGLPLRAVRSLRGFLEEAQDVRRELAYRGRALAETLGQTLRTPSETPINRPIGPHRRFDWMTMQLADVKAIRRRLGGSLNDVVLTVVTGAVRRFLTRRGVDLRGLDFRIMAPVSVRREDERGQLGNQVSAWIVPLPLDEADPRAQLARIHETTTELKDSKQAVAASALTSVAEWTPATLLSLGARNATRLLPFNMVVTNVPGPQSPIHLCGARMSECFPHVPLLDRLGLGVALLSYDGRLCWGFNADFDLVPDLDRFVVDVREAYEALRKLGEEARVEPPPAAEHGEERAGPA